MGKKYTVNDILNDMWEDNLDDDKLDKAMEELSPEDQVRVIEEIGKFADDAVGDENWRQ